MDKIIDKIVFVGLHNKPGFKPLDSRTRTGQVIDEISCNIHWECQRVNLFPINYRPDFLEGEQYIDQFANAIDDNTLYIGLGRISCDALARMNIDYIAVHHPGFILRTGQVKQYVQHVVDLIYQKLWPEIGSHEIKLIAKD